MVDDVREGKELLKRSGLRYFLKCAISYIYDRTIRNLQPTVAYRVKHGVVVNENIKPLDPFLLRDFSYVGEFEGGLVKSHYKWNEFGNDMVSVGGGFGITVGVASNLIGSEGSITVYEADSNRIKNLTKILELNDISNVEVEHAAVGDLSIEVDSIPKIVSPENLSACDILELDCEGSEYQIISEMNITPNIVIVELHPNLLDVDVEQFTSLLKESGYEIVDIFGHEGIPLSEKEFELLINETNDRLERNGGEYPNSLPDDFGVLDNGAKIPPILVARYQG